MIADDFKEIYENYEKERTKPLKGNKLAIKMRHEFNENFRDFLSEIVSDDLRTLSISKFILFSFTSFLNNFFLSKPENSGK